MRILVTGSHGYIGSVLAPVVARAGPFTDSRVPSERGLDLRCRKSRRCPVSRPQELVHGAVRTSRQHLVDPSGHCEACFELGAGSGLGHLVELVDLGHGGARSPSWSGS